MKADYNREAKVLTLTEDYIDIKSTFDCGQFFRYFSDENGEYIIAGGELLNIRNEGESLIIHPVEENTLEMINSFLHLDMSYKDIENNFISDDILSKTIPVCHGMRILKQDEWETIISFIISANNNIGRIKKIIEAISKLCGEKKICGDRVYYAFPTPQALSKISVDELYKCGCGYRAPYIKNTSTAIANGFDIKCVYEMGYDEGKNYLCQLMGVGPKVADCILLFAYNKFEAFPVDTWVKKILKELYNFEPKNNREAVAFAHKNFGSFAGIAQQYLFHYVRTTGILAK